MNFSKHQGVTPHSQHKYPTAEKTKTGKTFFAKHDETGIKKNKVQLIPRLRGSINCLHFRTAHI